LLYNGNRKEKQMNFVIEKNVPIPPPGQTKYPWAEMEVGDSFLVPADKGNSAKTAASHFIRRNPGKKFLSRAEGDELRIWRVK